jgi:adenylate/nucleoside-diphosphate kinase
VVDY